MLEPRAGMGYAGRMVASSASLIQDVRAGDYLRFLAIQLAPAAKREALYALTAFHLELARIAEIVSEPMLGQIRLAWWREGLEEIAAGAAARNHPVLLGLAALYNQTPAVFAHLFAMIEARAVDLDESLLQDEGAWFTYLDGTAGALHQAWAIVLDDTSATGEQAAILAHARRYAIIGLILAMPHHHQHGFVRVPQSWLTQYGCNGMADSPSLIRLVTEQLLSAHEAIHVSNLPAPYQPLVLLTRFANMRCRALQRAGYNPYRVRHAQLAYVWQAIKKSVI